jgi:hypothetical protein
MLTTTTLRLSMLTITPLMRFYLHILFKYFKKYGKNEMIDLFHISEFDSKIIRFTGIISH